MLLEAKPGIIALLSPCGHGNLGDAAIQQAAIDHIRHRLPQSEIIGITLVPADTVERHAIESYPIAGLSRPEYGVLVDGTKTVEAAVSVQDDTLQKREFGTRIKQMLIGLVRLILPRGLPYLVRTEWNHWRMAYRLAGRIDLLVVSGGGQLDDYWGGPWGHPYAMFKWVLLARLRGASAVFLSVGFGTLNSPVSRFFARNAFRMACYRSYRDEGSRQACEKLGFPTDAAVLPDLAFSVGAPRAATADTASRLKIGISPMVYKDPRTWPEKDQCQYRHYIDKLVRVAEDCLESGIDICLLASDGPDDRSIDEIIEALRANRLGELPGRLEKVAIKDVDQFLDTACGLSVMVVTRLHGAILSFIARSVVIALSYDRKVTALMEEMGETENCLDVDAFSPEQVVEIVRRRVRQPLSRETRIRIEECERRLTEQYDLVFGPAS